MNHREEIFKSSSETGTYNDRDLERDLRKREKSEEVYLDPCVAKDKTRSVISVGKDFEFKDDVKIILGEGFKYVDRCCFDNSQCFNKCGQITGFVAPKTLVGIGDTAFYYATKLSDVKLNEGLRFIDSDAFKNCYRLEQLILPASVEEIGKTAFKGSGLTVLVCHEKQLDMAKALVDVEQLLQIFVVDDDMLVKQTLVKKISKGFKQSNDIDATVKKDVHVMALISDTMSKLIAANPDNLEVLQKLIDNIPAKKLGNLADFRTESKKKKVADEVII